MSRLHLYARRMLAGFNRTAKLPVRPTIPRQPGPKGRNDLLTGPPHPEPCHEGRPACNRLWAEGQFCPLLRHFAGLVWRYTTESAQISSNQRGIPTLVAVKVVAMETEVVSEQRETYSIDLSRPKRFAQARIQRPKSGVPAETRLCSWLRLFDHRRFIMA